MAKALSGALIDNAPALALWAGANALGIHYRLNRYTSRMRRLKAEWQKLESLPLERLEERQRARLRYILQQAAKTPFYAERFNAAGMTPDDITSAGDLAGLPVLTRQDIRDNFTRMTVPDTKVRTIVRKSSGTTGEPIRFLQSHQQAFDNAYAALYQFYGWHGVRPLSRRASLAGRYMGKNPKGVVLRNFAENQLLLGVHALSPSNVSYYIEGLRRFRPELLQAHPSALLLLRGYSIDQGINPPSVPAIAFTGETLMEDERATLMDWFGGTVFGTYGSGEQHVTAGECAELNGYHMHPEFSVTRLVNTPAGRQIVSTSLLNDVMPLINYQIGDLAEGIVDTQCMCGRTWPRLKGLQGRADDTLATTYGKPVAPVTVRTGMAAHFSKLPAYTIIQHQEQGSYTLQLFTGEPPEAFERVGAYIADLLGPGAAVRIQCITPDRRFSVRGKHKMVVRE